MPSHSNGDNMARYTDQQTFTYSPKREDLILLTDANGGNLTIEGLDYQFLGNKFENNSLIK